MSRVFVPITTNELKKKIEACDNDITTLTPTVEKDLSKVKFSIENITDEGYTFGCTDLLGYKTLSNGMSYLGVCAGGDWETPIFFCIYWDGSKLRGYIPTDGNLWNTDTKEAYGNDEKADLKNARKRWPNNRDLDNDDIDLGGYFDNYDSEAIRKDMMERILEKSLSKSKKTSKVSLAQYSDQELIEELRKRRN